jgi:hypothetical protein
MQKEPEDWTAEEVARFFSELQSRDGTTEDIEIVKRRLRRE